ncbi:Protein of unknown function [Bacillus wiedmannii]|nr:Protein of unknown function [Bacillus wiedmannii]
MKGLKFIFELPPLSLRLEEGDS